MRQIDIMAVLAAVDQRTDLGVETGIAADSARSRCMAAFAETKILFCGRAMKGWSGKGECVRHRTGNMGVRMANYSVKTGRGTAYPGYPPLASLLQKIAAMALRTLVGRGTERNSVISAVKGHPA